MLWLSNGNLGIVSSAKNPVAEIGIWVIVRDVMNVGGSLVGNAKPVLVTSLIDVIYDVRPVFVRSSYRGLIVSVLDYSCF